MSKTLGYVVLAVLVLGMIGAVVWMLKPVPEPGPPIDIEEVKATPEPEPSPEPEPPPDPPKVEVESAKTYVKDSGVPSLDEASVWVEGILANTGGYDLKNVVIRYTVTVTQKDKTTHTLDADAEIPRMKKGARVPFRTWRVAGWSSANLTTWKKKGIGQPTITFEVEESMPELPLWSVPSEPFPPPASKTAKIELVKDQMHATAYLPYDRAGKVAVFLDHARIYIDGVVMNTGGKDYAGGTVRYWVKIFDPDSGEETKRVLVANLPKIQKGQRASFKTQTIRGIMTEELVDNGPDGPIFQVK